MKVAIWMVTYNHAQFIEEAIISVVNQQTNFPFKLFIGDDCSKDSTSKICNTLQKQFPDKIDVVSHKNNLGPIKNALTVYKRVFESGASFIAMCEGDDYWLDEYKLQKQVDFLEKNLQYSFCFHDVLDLLGNGNFGITSYCSTLKKQHFTINDIANFVNIPTLSVVFRNTYITIPPDFKMLPIGDWPLFMLLAEKGDAYFIKEIMGVYRKHEGGINALKGAVEQNKNKIKAIESVLGWMKQKKNFRVVKELEKVYNKTVYYQIVLLLKQPNSSKDLWYFSKLLCLSTPPYINFIYKTKLIIRMIVAYKKYFNYFF